MISTGEWEKIDAGWYVHESGAIVQRWNDWCAWLPTAKDHEHREFKTLRDACKWVEKDYILRMLDGSAK